MFSLYVDSININDIKKELDYLMWSICETHEINFLLIHLQINSINSRIMIKVFFF